MKKILFRVMFSIIMIVMNVQYCFADIIIDDSPRYGLIYFLEELPQLVIYVILLLFLFLFIAFIALFMVLFVLSIVLVIKKIKKNKSVNVCNSSSEKENLMNQENIMGKDE